MKTTKRINYNTYTEYQRGNGIQTTGMKKSCCLKRRWKDKLCLEDYMCILCGGYFYLCVAKDIFNYYRLFFIFPYLHILVAGQNLD